MDVTKQKLRVHEYDLHECDVHVYVHVYDKLNQYERDRIMKTQLCSNRREHSWIMQQEHYVRDEPEK